MARGADLFVVCKNCGSEVSPYVTECPYCGQRVRKRAPKIERGSGNAIKEPEPSKPRRSRKRAGRSQSSRFERVNPIAKLTAGDRPLGTIALVAAMVLGYLVLFAGAFSPIDVIVIGKVHGDWWKLVTAPLVHWGGGGSAVFAGGAYQFATIVAIGIFGTLLERRHGAFVVLAIALVAGAGGMFVAQAIESFPIADGANGIALALLCAWAVPDLLAWRRSAPYDGDLLGTAVIAAVLLALPLAVDTADAYAGVTGAIVGLVAGLPLARVAQRA